MVLITIVNGVYKPTYNWGAPPCIDHKKTVQNPLIILNSSIIERKIIISHIISQIFSDNMWSIVILWLPCLPQSSEVPYPIEMSPIPKLRWRRRCLTQSGDENIRKPCLDIFGTSWWFQHVSTSVLLIPVSCCDMVCQWFVSNITAELLQLSGCSQTVATSLAPPGVAIVPTRWISGWAWLWMTPSWQKACSNAPGLPSGNLT